MCPPEDKCEVKIADFDSVKMFTPGVSAASVPDLACEPKPSGVKVLGTPFYRAPEVSVLTLCVSVHVLVCTCVYWWLNSNESFYEQIVYAFVCVFLYAGVGTWV